jgi:hypothetical protein
MKLPIILLTGLLFAATCPTSAAEDAPQWLPPVKLRAPATIKCEVAIERPARNQEPAVNESGEAKQTPPPELIREVAEKDGEYYRVLRSFSDSTEHEYWVLPSIQFLRSPKSNEPVRLLPGDSQAVDFSECDFPELAWALGLHPSLVKQKDGSSFLIIEVQAKDRPLTKKENAELAELRRFAKANGEEPEEFEGNPFRSNQGGSLKLFINPSTLLPVRFEESGTVRTYRFRPSPGLKTILPEAFNGAIRKWHMEHVAASRKPTPP